MSHLFESVVESDFFEPERFFHEQDGLLEISEKDQLSSKQQSLRRPLNAGQYTFYFKCEDGKITIDFTIKDRTDARVMNVHRALRRGDNFDRSFEVSLEDEPNVFELTMQEGTWWKRSKYDYTLRCTKSFRAPVKKKKKIRCRVYVDGKLKWVHLTNTVQFPELQRQFADRYGPGKVLKYEDRYQEIATIDDQESLDIFLEEHSETEEPPKIYYVLPDVVRLESLSPIPGMQPNPHQTFMGTIGGVAAADADPSRHRLRHLDSVVMASIQGSPSKTPSPSTLESDFVAPGQWQQGAPIGKGGFAKVYLGMNERCGRLIAIKEITLSGKITEGMMEDLKSEIRLMQQLSHDNIVRYLGCERKVDKLFIFQDYIPGGSLESILRDFSFTEPLIRGHTRQILHGLKYLHDNDIIHRDIKCANILLDEHGRIYLADFGCSKKITQDLTTGKSGYFGTPNFMPPEVVKNPPIYTNAADIWALGCTILEMMNREPPWQDIMIETDCDPVRFLFYMAQHFDDLPIPIPKGISPLFRSFLELCFVKDHEQRATCEQLLAHPWLSNELRRRPMTPQKPKDPDPPLTEELDNLVSRPGAKTAEEAFATEDDPPQAAAEPDFCAYDDFDDEFADMPSYTSSGEIGHEELDPDEKKDVQALEKQWEEGATAAAGAGTQQATPKPDEGQPQESTEAAASSSEELPADRSRRAQRAWTAVSQHVNVKKVRSEAKGKLGSKSFTTLMRTRVKRRRKRVLATIAQTQQ